MLKRTFISSVACAALISLPLALSFPTPSAAAINEILVTARKRVENLQSVPLAVTTFSLVDIQRKSIDGISDIAKLTSSLIYDIGAAEQDTRITVRGLAPTRGRQNVATLVDGIDISSEAIATSGGSLLINPRLIDIERIEIVKGPQSALYGRSAFAGALQYITKDASEEFEGNAAVDVGEYGRYEVQGGISGPIVEDILGFRLNGAWWDEEGFDKNSVTEQRIGGAEGFGLAGTINFNPTKSLSFKARAEYTDDEFQQAPQAFMGFNTDLAPPASAFAPVAGPPAGPAVLGCNTTLETLTGGTGVFCDNTIQAFVGTVPDGDTLSVALTPDPTTGRDFPGTDRDILRLSLVGEWDIGFGTLTSWTGYTDANSSQEADFTNFAIKGAVGSSLASRTSLFRSFTSTEQFSQELRFASEFDGPLQVTVGGLYWDESIKQQQRDVTIIGAGVNCFVIEGPAGVFTPFASGCPGFNSIPVESTIPGALAARGAGNPVNRSTEHYSFYGMFEWDITGTAGFGDKLPGEWTLSFEARYNKENEDVLGPLFDVAGTGPGTLLLCGSFGNVCDPSDLVGPFMLSGTTNVVFGTKSKWWTPRTTLEWQANDDMLFYASYAQGKKPGGISTNSVGSAGFENLDNVRFGQEKMVVYEVGAKTSWFGNTLQVNGAAYFQDFGNKQVNTSIVLPNGFTAPRIVNAGKAEIWGLELDTLWQPERQVLGGNWVFTGSYTYLDTEYKKFDSISSSATTIARAGDCTPFFLAAESKSFCAISSAGNELEGAPHHSLTGTAAYTSALLDTGFDWFIETDVQFQSSRFVEFNNILKLQSFWNTDMRVGVQNDKWELLFYVSNLFNDDTVKSAIAALPGLGCCFNIGSGIIGGGGPAGGVFVGVDVPSVSLGLLPPPRHVGFRTSLKF